MPELRSGVQLHDLPGAGVWKALGWAAPQIAVWITALTILRNASLGADCSALCMVAQGWLLYTVAYAAASVSAVVAALEVIVWLFHGRRRHLGSGGVEPLTKMATDATL